MKNYLYSYDIFDTLVTRKTATPEGIFLIIQNKLQHQDEFRSVPEHIVSNYPTFRKLIEISLKKMLSEEGGEEITLDDIYESFILHHGVSKDVARLLKKCEIETELENIVGIHSNIDILKSHLSAGDKVVLISDMYLPEDIIRQMLISIDGVFANIPIYVSSSVRLTKASGNLYKYISEKESCAYDDWTHLGDNSYSDVLVPKKLGILAQRYNITPYLPYEKEILKLHANNLTAQLLIGNARRIRVNTPHISTLGIIGCSLSIPLLYDYISWVLNMAKSIGLSNLYFISRDGFVLKIIADQIINIQNLNITTHYIYGSRLAWRIDELESLIDFEKHNLVFRINNLADVAQYLSLDIDTLRNYLPPIYQNTSSTLSSEEVKEILSVLFANAEFKSLVRDAISTRRRLVKEYLLQEIHDSHVGFVDLYGTGTTMNYISDMLNETQPTESLVFYLSGLPKPVHPKLHTLFWQYDLPLGGMLEILCRAPHGQTLGYRTVNGVIQPIFDAEINNGDDFEQYIELISLAARELTQSLDNSGLLSLDLNVYRSYYDVFTRRPDKFLLNTLSDIPYASTTGVKATVFAPRCGLFSILLDYFKNGNIGNKTGSISYSLRRVSALHAKIGDYIIDGYQNKHLLKKYIEYMGLFSFIHYWIFKK
ncbi:MAG: hypothetical protein IJA20_05230 [Methanocorpusculum sp.]|nr:hypothetical protein [Methanocorpusculum sp.]